MFKISIIQKNEYIDKNKTEGFIYNACVYRLRTKPPITQPTLRNRCAHSCFCSILRLWLDCRKVINMDKSEVYTELNVERRLYERRNLHRTTDAELDDYEKYVEEIFDSSNINKHIKSNALSAQAMIRTQRYNRDRMIKKHGYKSYDEHLENKRKQEEKYKPMGENKDCALFLGCHIAERILSHIFKRVKQLPYNHPGYDFVCGKGFKVDVKASCVTDQRFQFTINRNKQPDYFLLIAFDNRNDLNPLGVWLVKSDEVIRGRKLNEFHTLGVLNRSDKLRILKKYEQTEKLECVLECCDNLKTKKQCNII